MVLDDVFGWVSLIISSSHGLTHY